MTEILSYRLQQTTESKQFHYLMALLQMQNICSLEWDEKIMNGE
jgi:tRNA A37 threonylcarbamoyladenosine biosynthesis protein TsaE